MDAMLYFPALHHTPTAAYIIKSFIVLFEGQCDEQEVEGGETEGKGANKWEREKYAHLHLWLGAAMTT